MKETTGIQLPAVETVLGKILLIRGQKVMIDKDLAALYEVDTKCRNRPLEGILIDFRKILCLFYVLTK